MFGWVDSRKEGKRGVESMSENEWEGCLVGREREKNGKGHYFCSDPPKLNLLKINKSKSGTKNFGLKCSYLPK